MDFIKNITPKHLVEGITGYYAHGEQMSFGYVALQKGSSVPLHNHVHEQITFVLEGELEMVIGDEKCLLKNGMYHVINSNVPHSALALTDCKVIDTFCPVREDYRT